MSPHPGGGNRNFNVVESHNSYQNNKFNQQKINLLAEGSQDIWEAVPNTDFLEIANVEKPIHYYVSVYGSGQIVLFNGNMYQNLNDPTAQLRLTKDVNAEGYYLYFNSPKKLQNFNKTLAASIDISTYTLKLSGGSSAAISVSSSNSQVNPRSLTIKGENNSQLILENPFLGMNLSGELDFQIIGVSNLIIKGADKNNPASRAGITLLEQNNWNNTHNVPNVVVNIEGNDKFEISGNIAHAISSYGNNSFVANSNEILIKTEPFGRPTKNNGTPLDFYEFYSLISGSGKISLTGKERFYLEGLSEPNEQENGLYLESYAIRGSEIVCDSCSSKQTRYFNADFELVSDKSIDLKTNWGAIFMNALEDTSSGEQYFAKTSLEAPEIRIVASGTSKDQKTNASFKAISDFDKAYAQINLKASEQMSVDYRDALDKEKKQDIFYSFGKTAGINLEAPLIEINNNYENVKGQSADVRSVFFADNSSNISVSGRTAIVGNTIARDAGSVSLNLAEGSVLTGAVFDNSFPHYDSTIEDISTFGDKGSVEINGSSSSVWNVKPFYDVEERGLIFNKKTVRSTVNVVNGNNATKDNPFIVNLTEGPKQGQKLNITNLTPEGYVQFNLRFDDQKGSNSGVNNGRDSVVIHNGDGTHGLFVQYVGDQSSQEPESLRDSWLVSDNSQKAKFELANPGGTVDIGVYKYSLTSEIGESELGGKTQANYWYLKRASNGPQGPGFTPAADTEISFAGSQRYLHWADLQVLRKRLGEVRYGSQDGAWVRGIYQKDLADGESGASGMKQNYYGINFGADRLTSVTEERMWLLGASVNLGRAKQKTRDNNNGSGDTDRYGVNAYATWAANNGCYADIVLSADYFRQDVTTRANSVIQKGKYNTFGLGASIEVGKQFTFNSKNNTWGPWYQHTWIEPQLQLSYYWLKGEDYKLSNKGLKVKIKDDDSLIGRAGIVIGTKWNYGQDYQDIDKRYVQAHLKGGVKHDFLGNYKVSLNDQIFSKDIGKTTVYYGAGMDWQASKQMRIYLQVEREHGSHYTKEIEISAGVKYQF